MCQSSSNCRDATAKRAKALRIAKDFAKKFSEAAFALFAVARRASCNPVGLLLLPFTETLLSRLLISRSVLTRRNRPLADGVTAAGAAGGGGVMVAVRRVRTKRGIKNSEKGAGSKAKKCKTRQGCKRPAGWRKRGRKPSRPPKISARNFTTQRRRPSRPRRPTQRGTERRYRRPCAGLPQTAAT